MKRQVYVPNSLLENENIPQEAITLAKEVMLPIRIGDVEKDPITSICVINVPELHSLFYKESVKRGFIQIFDYTNEYVEFGENVNLIIQNPDGTKSQIEPRIKENHALRYRHRFHNPGTYGFCFTHGADSVLKEGHFVVL